MSKPPAGAFTVKVPTKTYLRKYISGKYGSPLPLNYNSTLGTLVLSLLEKEAHSINMAMDKQDGRLAQMPDRIEFRAPLKTLAYKGHYLTPAKVIAINRFLENTFITDLYHFCREHKKQREWRPGIDQAIHSFAERYGIEMDVDITFDAMKKAEWRHRKKQEEILKTFVPSQQRPMQLFFA